MNPKVAYLTNVYPAPSHSFIRREILALEAIGWEVFRYSIRRTDSPLRDPQDQDEATKTTFLLDAGIVRLLVAAMTSFLRSPFRFLRAARMAWKLGRRSDRGLLHHAIYLAEACHLKQQLASHEIRHLHAHFGTNSAAVALLCHALRGPQFSVTVHGPEEFDKATILGLEHKIHFASFVVGISSFGKSQLYRWCDLRDWPKIQVVHCGLDAAYLENVHAPVSDSRRFVCVGRLCEQKGQLLLVEAFARLLGELKVSTSVAEASRLPMNQGTLGEFLYEESPSVAEVAKTSSPSELSASSATKNSSVAEIARIQKPELVLVGDGPMRPQIEARIRELGIEESVRITGWASGETVQQEIAAARAMVLPSFAEGLPVVIMEALAMERPVISTYIAGIPELVIPGENGWLVPAGDVDALVNAIQQALETPVERLKEMGRAGLARVLERHNIRTEVAKLAELFEASVKR